MLASATVSSYECLNSKLTPTLADLNIINACGWPAENYLVLISHFSTFDSAKRLNFTAFGLYEDHPPAWEVIRI